MGRLTRATRSKVYAAYKAFKSFIFCWEADIVCCNTASPKTIIKGLQVM